MKPNFQPGDNYRLLISKLDSFIRKFYKSKVIKGLLLVIGILLISYIVVSLLEYLGRFNTITRTILFYSYIALNLFVIGSFIVYPILQLFRIGKIITHKQAARIIGIHFSNIKDKLLNTLQLREMINDPVYLENHQLIQASVNQKIEELKSVTFSSAINFFENRKYLKFTIIPLLVLGGILIVAPNVLQEGTTRLLSHKKYFEIEMPFEFIILNDSMKVLRNEDFDVGLKIKGEIIPSKVFIKIDGKDFLMSKVDNSIFRYNVKKVRNDFDFKFVTDEFSSKPYYVKVLPKPLLSKFKVKIEYPKYIKKKSSILENIGDLTIPAGTKVSWQFFTSETDRLDISFSDTSIEVDRNQKDRFDYFKTFLKDDYYSIKTSNKFVTNDDSLLYYINTIPDAFPRISVLQQKDSFSNKFYFFTGEISDDYGINRLTFNYNYIESEDSLKLNSKVASNLKIFPGKNYQNFLHSWDLNQLSINAGDVIEYYFEVWDNDGVNGSKSSKSEKFIFKAPSLKEIEEKTDKLSSDIKSELSEAVKKARKIQEDLKKAKKRLLENKILKWEDKKFIEDILKRQNKLKKELEDIKEKYIENVMTQDDYEQLNEEMLEKYEKLYELFEELIPDEIKELYEELGELLDKNMKDQMQKELDNLDLSNEDLEKELERMLELFKHLELELKTDQLIDKLDKLADEQEKLSEETLEKNNPEDKLLEKQEKLNKKFDEIEKDFEHLEKLNEELNNKMPLDETESDRNEVKSQQGESMENLKNSKKKKAGQNQKNAAQQMKELSKKMSSMQMEMQMETMQINYQKLRQILENLVYLSFEQEKLLIELKTINRYNPQYVELAQEQKKLKEDAKMIEDSLFALSKEVPQIESFINKELNQVNFNLDKTIDLLSARKIPEAREKQQYVMTAINNIAVLLSELLKSMQEQMSGQMSGEQMCQSKMCGSKKGGGIKSLRELQQKLNEQIKGLKSGKTKGQKMSKALAQLAAQQEMLRNQLRKLNEANNKGGRKSLGDLDNIQKLMEETERDLVNKQITPKTLERQKEITVKLLEAERAEKEQGQEERRESKTARDIFNQNPPSIEEYRKQKHNEIELLQTVPPALNGYYKIKVKEYFNQIR